MKTWLSVFSYILTMQFKNLFYLTAHFFWFWVPHFNASFHILCSTVNLEQSIEGQLVSTQKIIATSYCRRPGLSLEGCISEIQKSRKIYETCFLTNILPGEQLGETLGGFLWSFVFITLLLKLLSWLWMCKGKPHYRKETFSVHARRPHLYVGRLHDFSLVFVFCIKSWFHFR